MNGFTDGTFVAEAKRTDVDYARVAERLQDHRILQLLHAAMGMQTEAAEFTDMLKKHIFYGKPLDRVNLIEELGDQTWYERIAIDALETTLVEVYQRNIEKLRKRYPEKFSEEKALNRDLDGERKVLEG